MKAIEKLTKEQKLFPPDSKKVEGWTDNLMWDKLNEIIVWQRLANNWLNEIAARLDEITARIENPAKFFKNDVR